MKTPANTPNLGALLADPAAVPVEQIPAALGDLERVKAVLWARLMATSVPRGQPGSPSHRYLTQAEAAETFGIPLSTVRFLTRRGRVPSIGRGKNRRLLPADLQHYVAECARTGKSLRPPGRKKKVPLDRDYANGIEGPIRA